MGYQPVTVTDNTYMIWQTILAVLLVAGMVGGGFVKLFRTIPKKADIVKLQTEADERKKENAEQNKEILDLVKEIREDIKTDRQRLDNHIDASRHRPSAEKPTP